MFRNIKFFVLTKPLALTNPKNKEALSHYSFSPCTQQQQEQKGWVSPFSVDAQSLLHEASGNCWLTMQKEQKLLPASVVNQKLEEKLASLDQENQSISKKQKKELRDDIVFQLLAQAFSKFSKTHGVVCEKDELLWVDAASDNKAEEFCSLLRQSLGSLPISSFSPDISPAQKMTSWLLNGNLPNDFELNDEAELRDTAEDGGIIRFKQQVLNDDEVIAHIKAGKEVTQLRITWNQTLSCTIKSDLSIKRISFADQIKEQNDDVPSDDTNARLEADFVLMSGEINRFIRRLIEVFGSNND